MSDLEKYKGILRDDDSQAGAGCAACTGSAFVVINLRNLKIIKRDTRDDCQDVIRALRANSAAYVALRWHAGAETYVQLEAHE